MLRLILPDTRYLTSYIEALREGFYRGINPTATEEEIRQIEADPLSHFVGLNQQGGSFTPPDGIAREKVPFNDFWLVDDKDFIGSVNIRWQMNDFLELHGGHIGYGTRPSMKRKGYATKGLSLGLDKLAAIGTKVAIMTADDDNIGSWKAIEANGGVLVEKTESIFHAGSLSRRYTIDLTKREGKA